MIKRLNSLICIVSMIVNLFTGMVFAESSGFSGGSGTVKVNSPSIEWKKRV